MGKKLRFVKQTSLVKDCQNAKYAKALPSALEVVSVLQSVEATHLGDIKNIFGKKVDFLKNEREFTCFDLAPEAHRLITYICYTSSTVLYKEILTHAEYDVKYVDKKKRR